MDNMVTKQSQLSTGIGNDDDLATTSSSQQKPQLAAYDSDETALLDREDRDEADLIKSVTVLGMRKRDDVENTAVALENPKKTVTEIPADVRAQTQPSSQPQILQINLNPNDPQQHHAQPQQQQVLLTAAIKLLCPSECIGSLIGKGGSIITSLNQYSGASIKVSQSGEFYPNTTDRVVFIVGEAEKLYVAVDNVVKIICEGTTPTATTMAGSPCQCRILLPVAAVGVVIGRGGSIIKSINEKATSRCSMAENSDHTGSLTGERIMTVVAQAYPNVAYAIKLIVVQMLTEKNAVYTNCTTKYSSPLNNIRFQGQNTGSLSSNGNNPIGYQPGFPLAHSMAPGAYNFQYQQQQHQHNPNLSPLDHLHQAQSHIPYGTTSASTVVPISLTFGIPDRLVGGVVGKQGSIIKEVMALTGTVIKFAQKGVYLPGTENRAMTITGPYPQVQLAQAMISQRVAQETVKQGMQPFVLSPSNNVNGV